MAMSGGAKNDSGLTAAQLKSLRARLEQLQTELAARIGAEQSVALDAEPLTELGDAAEQTQEQDDAIASANRDRALLQEIQRALAKLEGGGYGISEVSGRPIGFRRLEAIPWARSEADQEP
jgi:DnaK suppressor protein